MQLWTALFITLSPSVLKDRFPCAKEMELISQKKLILHTEVLMLYSDVFPVLEAMSNDLLARCKEIVSLRTQLSKVGLFPDSELEADISCVYRDFKIWREFVDTYFNGIDPFIGE